MTYEVLREPSSFRDPAGSVYLHDGRVFRTVAANRAEDFVEILRSDLFRNWMDSNRTVRTSLHTDAEARGLIPDLGEGVLVLEHDRLPFVSYPYEWPFALLKKAALFHLDLQKSALAADVAFSDASAFNVQFVGTSPILMDILSLRCYRPGEYWTGYRQFCEQFLNPLLLASDFGIQHHNYYRGSLNGFSVEDTASLYSWSALRSWRLATHVFLHAAMIKKARRAAGAGKPMDIEKVGRPLSKSGYLALLSGLHTWISKLKPKGMTETVWSSYEFDHSYNSDEEQQKRAVVARWIDATQVKTVWDMGCNSGAYSELALESGASQVFGFDIDPGALEAAVVRSESRNLAFLPLHLDAINPPAQVGWRQNERRGLVERRNADGLLALALLHHLVIGANVPLEQAVDWLISLAPQGIIEFVPTDDPMVARMLINRRSGVHAYDLEILRAAIENRAKILSEHSVSESGRRLIAYSRGA